MGTTPWVSAKEASLQLGISESTLSVWRQVGYLKPGTHWRSSSEFFPVLKRIVRHFLVTEFHYHLEWCREEMDYWRSHDAKIVENIP